MGRRTLLLIAALLVAALGTVLVFLYAQNAQNNAAQGQELVKVLVAKTKIDLGTTGATASANGAFDQAEVPRSTVVAGALSDATPLTDLVALVPVFPGQQIIAPQWGAAAQTSGLALPAGKVAMSVQLGDPERVAGFVAPGSTIGIMTYGATAPTTSGQAGKPNVRALLSNIQVIAVGPTTTIPKTDTSGSTTTNAEQIPTAILTLAVTQQEAEKIIFASGKAPGSSYTGLYFVLLDKSSKLVIGDPGVTNENLFK